MAYLNDKEILFSTNIDILNDGKVITSTNLDNGTQELDITNGIFDEDFVKSLISKEITEIKAENLEGITSIGTAAFCDCIKLIKLEAKDLEGITSIGMLAFSGCENLTKVELPASIKTMEVGAFSDCKNLSSVDIVNTQLEIISNSAFSGCTSLTEIALPASVKELDNFCFANTGLTKIRFYSQTPPIAYNSNPHSFPNLEVIEVPEGCSEAFKADEILGQYTIVEFSI